MSPNQIKEAAMKELREEQFREAVESYKKKLKAAKWWHKLLPFRVVILKREKL